jgi:hypothetical protein
MEHIPGIEMKSPIPKYQEKLVDGRYSTLTTTVQGSISLEIREALI